MRGLLVENNLGLISMQKLVVNRYYRCSVKLFYHDSIYRMIIESNQQVAYKIVV